MRRRFPPIPAALAASLALALACGGGGSSSDPGGTDPGADGTGADALDDLPVQIEDRGAPELPDLAADDTPADVPPDDAPAADADVPLPCPGSNGCTCGQDSECYSGRCVETMEGGLCLGTCGNGVDCPPGWACRPVSVGGESIYGCEDPFPDLCRPCVRDQDCQPQGGPDGRSYLCLPGGPGGRTCGAPCETDADCPSRLTPFACLAIPTEAGEVRQCRPAQGECPCTQKFVDRAYRTECYQRNDAGTCKALRTCDRDCPAATPAFESCNLLDDDCDGLTDEEIPELACQLKNQYGTCPGVAYCIGGQPDRCLGTYAAPETCNGADDDCNGTTDEVFDDSDADGIADCVDPDRDGDGVPNDADNCPDDANADQANNDGALETGPSPGDACDDDDDGDGVPDVSDNCPFVPNGGQSNVDGDGDGDACDCDADGDGIPNAAPLDLRGAACPDPGPGADLCPLVPDVEQANADGDGAGDACDCDADDDGIPNNAPGCPAPDVVDNCRLVANPLQENADRDPAGDACDCDADNDTVPNNAPGCPPVMVPDNCPLAANRGQQNTDALQPGGDGLGDACDCDIDADGVANDNPGCPVADPADNCPYTPNPDQANTNGGPFGDACFCDWDHDGVDSAGCGGTGQPDNCPRVANPDQGDADLDGAGDACDCDADGDGIANAGVDFDGQACPGPDPADNCDLIANPDQADLDRDGIGDACDCDVDGDGDPQPNFGCPTPVPGDCDPFDPGVSHGTVESCDGKDDDCDGITDEEDAAGCVPWHYDLDGDGYGTAQSRCLCAAAGLFRAPVPGDCADEDPTRNPGLPEVCNNGRDDNCNSTENDLNAVGCTRFYKDGDGDTYGTADFECRCYPGGGDYLARLTGDCADDDPGVNPGKLELCFDGIDNDCSGSQNDANAIGCSPFYPDVDGDGWGAKGVPGSCRCFAEGDLRATVTGDCDDAAGAVYPGHGEVCANGIDDDCDDLQDTEGAAGCAPWYYDGDGDGYGPTNTGRCLCAADPARGLTAPAGGECNDGNPAIHPGVADPCDGIDNDCSGTADDGFPDTDGDGLKDCADPDDDGDGDPDVTDCGPLDPGRHHGAAEVCDGQDTNCDGATDEGFPDTDGDGQKNCVDADDDNDGDPDTSDCAPVDAAIHHGATEVCNFLDDDCDNQADPEGTPGCTWFWWDGDADGYGSGTPKCLCRGGQVAGYTAPAGGDCNESNGAQNPGRAETCNNGVDDDCDGYADNSPGQPGAVCNVCGDGWIDNAEACDHGNQSPGTGCASDCRSIQCGGEPNSVNSQLNGTTCYWRTTTTRSRATAQGNCQAQRGYLVRMESAAEREWVFNNLIFPPGSGSKCWVGAQQCGGNWCWDDVGVVGGEFVWSPGEPSGNGSCVQSSGNGARYDDVSCGDSRDYVCERPRLGTPR